MYNVSIHKKIQTYKNINQKINNLSVVQDFMSTIGETSTVDDKIKRINDILIEKYEIKYSTIVVFNGAEYEIKASNVDQIHWDALRSLQDVDMFKDSIAQATPKYVTVNNDQERLPYQKMEFGRAKSAIFFPLYIDNVYIGYWIIESGTPHDFDNVDTTVLEVIKDNIVAVLKTVVHQKTLESIVRKDLFSGLYSEEYLYGEGRKIIDQYTTSTVCMYKITNLEEIEEYKRLAALKSDFERSELNKEKTGVEIKGIKAINPLTGKEIPIWASDYVLITYGTGAIMAVPAHDSRDWEFAKKFNLPIIPVIKPANSNSVSVDKEPFTDVNSGVIINSDFLNNLSCKQAINTVINYLEENNIGKRKVNYKLRDWVFSRQRYWGEPIPMVYCEKCGWSPLPENELPLVLPEIQDYEPSENGESPLAKQTDWINTTCPHCHGPAKRETDTMPQWAGSSWYYLRYIDPHNDNEIGEPELLKHWMPVDLYVGGPEHAVGHLLYSRMWCNYLYDKGISPVPEPFKKLVHQGMILGENNIKMGKRYPEYVVNPSDIVVSHGADALRLYEMFMGPLEADKPWSNAGIDASKKFLDRIYRLFEENKVLDKENKNLEKIYHQTIKKVTNDYETLNFNTAISQMMIFINAVYKEGYLPTEYAEGFVKILSPLCPHLGEELWSMLGHNNTITYEPWPTYDESKTTEDTIEIAIQVNGKVRDTVKVFKDISKEDLEKEALNSDIIKKWLEGKEVVKIITIPGRIVNIVIR